MLQIIWQVHQQAGHGHESGGAVSTPGTQLVQPQVPPTGLALVAMPNLGVENTSVGGSATIKRLQSCPQL